MVPVPRSARWENRRFSFEKVSRSALPFALIALGALSLGSQVLLLRALITVFLGSELTVGAALFYWMLLTALGVWAGHRHIPQNRRSATIIPIQILTAFVIPLTLFVVRSLRVIIGAQPGETLGLAALFLFVPLILSPLCLALGAQFTVLLSMLADGDASFPTPSAAGGYAYTLEAGGAAAGGAILTFLIIPTITPVGASFLLSVIQIVPCALFMSLRPARGWRSALLLPIVAGMLFSWVSGRVEGLSLRLQWRGLSPVEEKESPYGNIVIIKEGGQFTLYENGILSYSTQDDALREEAVHLPMLFRRADGNVLTIGMGPGTVREILKYPVVSVDYVQIDPVALKALSPFLPPETQASLSDPRVTVYAMDPRRFLKTSGETYDVILVDLPLPSTAVLNRCFTSEFFLEAGRRLSPGGILSLGLSSSESYVGRELRTLSSSIFLSLRRAFPYTRVIPGEKTWFIASYDQALVRVSSEKLAGLWARQHIPSRFITPYYVSYRFSEEKASRLMESLRIVAPVNTDLRPTAYFYGVLVFLSQFSPRAARALEGVSGAHPWIIMVPFLLVPFAGLLIRRDARGLPSMGIIGFAGMALEIALLYAFQSFYGYIYNAVGLLLASFMAGLALGGVAGLKPMGRKMGPFIILVVLALYSVCLVPLLPVLKGLFSPFLIPAFSLLIGVCGLMTGFAFPNADRAHLDGKGTPDLYAADLIGGGMGAFLTGIILVPLLGIPLVCILVGGMCAAALIGVRS